MRKKRDGTVTAFYLLFKAVAKRKGIIYFV